MKKSLITLLLSVLIFSSSKAQTFSFTIKLPGSTPNSVKVFAKPDGDITGVVSQLIVTFSLNAPAAPATDPTFTANPAFPQWGILSAFSGDETVNTVDSKVYTFFNAPATTTNSAFTANTEVLIGEITFADGTDLSSLLLVNLPDGGASGVGLLNVEIGGVNRSNATSLTYGAGAVVSNTGNGISYVPYATVLPVKFLSFYALKNGDAAKLTWTVADDANNQHFEIERSADGRKYAAFTRMNALGNGNAVNTYEAADPALSKQNSKQIYYRIKQVDKNGSSIYSQVRMLDVNKAGAAMSVYPNPARTIAKLVVDAPEAGKAAFILRDGTGKQVQLMNVQLVKGINQRDINVGMLPSGDYNISVVSEKLNQTIKLSKVN